MVQSIGRDACKQANMAGANVKQQNLTAKVQGNFMMFYSKQQSQYYDIWLP